MPEPVLPKNQQYGTRQRQEEAQRTQPVAGPRQAPPLPPPGAQPGQVPALTDPSALPAEPVQSGLPIGPGPGSDALASGSLGPEELAVAKAIARRYPYQSLLNLIQWAETNMATPPIPEPGMGALPAAPPELEALFEEGEVDEDLQSEAYADIVGLEGLGMTPEEEATAPDLQSLEGQMAGQEGPSQTPTPSPTPTEG